MTCNHILVPAHARAIPRIAGSAFIAFNAIIIGDVDIEAEASVWFGCAIRGDVQRISIGPCSYIQDGAVIHATTDGQPTVIGEDVTVWHAAVLHACTLEDGAFVGIGVCLGPCRCDGRCDARRGGSTNPGESRAPR
jgi:carbonic anhydrase/acetyltransferase-like protein (isoleucine patch superfamily)